eukprot:jgi/Mesvir1/24221/Mv10932-RA.1
MIAEHCPQLRHLDVSNTGVRDDGVVAMRRHSQVRSLNDAADTDVTDDGNTEEKLVTTQCAGWRGLRLRGCNVSNAALFSVAGHCPGGLHTLDIARCRDPVLAYSYSKSLTRMPSVLTDAAFAVFPVAAGEGNHEGPALCSGAVCQKLEHLEIIKCAQITDAGIGALLARCPHVRTLKMVSCAGVTDTCMVAVAEYCPGLRHLDLRGSNRVTDAGVRAVAAGCQRLTELSLRGCRGVTDEGVTAVVTGCRQLRLLNLQMCRWVTNASSSAAAKASVQLVG